MHEALVANFGAARPLELASWDGGHDSSNAWGEAWSRNSAALADVDGVTSHPYGGTGNRAQAILGNRHLVEAAHAASHKPIYITEVGFPTKGPTGDSLQYTEVEQAWALYQFATWARNTGYVAGVTFYGYRDGTGRRRLRRRDPRRGEEARLHGAAGAARKPALHDLQLAAPARYAARSAGGFSRSVGPASAGAQAVWLSSSARMRSSWAGESALLPSRSLTNSRHSRSRRACARVVLPLPNIAPPTKSLSPPEPIRKRASRARGRGRTFGPPRGRVDIWGMIGNSSRPRAFLRRLGPGGGQA